MKRFFPLYLFLLLHFPIQAFTQNTTASNIHFGIGYYFYYNYKMLHNVPSFSLGIRQHNISLGFQSTTVLKPLGDPMDSYKKKSYGVNFGYRYLLTDQQQKIVPFTQLNFSIYQLKYIEHQKGLPLSTKRQRLIVENTVSIGLNYNLSKHLKLYSGIGFGSFDVFFLMFESYLPTSYIGLEYKF